MFTGRALIRWITINFVVHSNLSVLAQIVIQVGFISILFVLPLIKFPRLSRVSAFRCSAHARPSLNIIISLRPLIFPHCFLNWAFRYYSWLDERRRRVFYCSLSAGGAPGSDLAPRVEVSKMEITKSWWRLSTVHSLAVHIIAHRCLDFSWAQMSPPTPIRRNAFEYKCCAIASENDSRRVLRQFHLFFLLSVACISKVRRDLSSGAMEIATRVPARVVIRRLSEP